MIVENIETKIRKLKIPQLEVLKLLADDPNGVSSNKEISDSTQTSAYTLGAVLTPIMRLKVGKEKLLIQAGRDFDGKPRWQINEKVIERTELKILLNSMGI